MAVTLAISCLALTAAWTLWNIYLITANYVTARKIGLPILICPVDTFNPLWLLARPVVAPTLRHLPFGLGEFARYSYIGWTWEYRYQLRESTLRRTAPPLAELSFLLHCQPQSGLTKIHRRPLRSCFHNNHSWRDSGYCWGRPCSLKHPQSMERFY